MKQKKLKHKSPSRRVRNHRRIFIIVILMLASIVTWTLMHRGTSFGDAREALGRFAACLHQKLDQIVEIIVIIVLATIKWIAERSRE